MSDDEAKAEEVKGEEEEEEEEEEDEASKEEAAEEEASEAEAEDAKDEATEPPKKRARKAAAPKAKEGKKGAAAGVKKKKRAAKKHPKTMDMVVEAVENLGERKGSSVQAIKSYILQNFKTVRTDMIKSMLRRALTVGLEQGTVTRPKGQADTQVMSGRYLLGKTAKKEDEIMPQSKRAQDAKRSAKKSKKKGGKKSKKVAKKPVARKAITPTKAKRPVKKAKRGKK